MGNETTERPQTTFAAPPLHDRDDLGRIADELAKLNENITRLGVLHADGINRFVAALAKLTHSVDAVAVAVEANL